MTQYATVLEDFDAVDDEEISLPMGTVCRIVTMSDDGWWTVATDDGKSGIFPGTYLELHELKEDEEADIPIPEEALPAPTPTPTPVTKPIAVAAPVAKPALKKPMRGRGRGMASPQRGGGRGGGSGRGGGAGAAGGRGRGGAGGGGVARLPRGGAAGAARGSRASAPKRGGKRISATKQPSESDLKIIKPPPPQEPPKEDIPKPAPPKKSPRPVQATPPVVSPRSKPTPVTIVSPRKQPDSAEAKDPSPKATKIRSQTGSAKTMGALSSNSSQTYIKEKPTILRIHHPEDMKKEYEERDFMQTPTLLKPFKSFAATSQKPAKSLVANMCNKLLLPDASKYRMFQVTKKDTSIKILRDDDKPVVIFKNTMEDIFFAVLYMPNQSKVQKLLSAIKEASNLFQIEKGDLTHRLLLQPDIFAKFADLVLSIGQHQLHTFQSIMEIRCPNLITSDLVQKKKEKTLSYGTKHIHLELKEGVLALETVEKVLDFAYSGKVDFINLSMEETMKLYKAANKLGAPKLERMCEVQLKNELDMHNVFPFVKCAHDLDIAIFKEFATDFCVSSWTQIASNKDGLSIIGIELFQELTMEVHGGRVPKPKTRLEPVENDVVEDFKKIRGQMHYADAVAKFGGDLVPFHKHILAAASEKFAQLLSKDSGSKKTIPQYHFGKITPDAFAALLDIIYYGSVENCSIASACNILEHGIIQYDLHTFREQIEEVLLEGWDKNDVLEVLRITYLPMSEGRLTLTLNLRSACIEFICTNFRDIKLDGLDKMDSRIVCDILMQLHRNFKSCNLAGVSSDKGSGLSSFL